MTPAASKTAFVTLRDVIALTKPRITLMVALTTATGMFVAPGKLPWASVLWMLLATATVVSAANSLNCYLERESDRLMERTRLRPLPDRRLDPSVALLLGVVLGIASVASIFAAINTLTAVLAAIALLSYVLVYTPLKPHSSVALLVGAVPGALPPLMGWTAVTGRLDGAGLALFAVLFFWQIPHFIAIAVVRRDDYARAGLRTLPAEKGLTKAFVHAVAYAIVLVPASLALPALGATGPLYTVVALFAGVWQAWIAYQAYSAARLIPSEPAPSMETLGARTHGAETLVPEAQGAEAQGAEAQGPAVSTVDAWKQANRAGKKLFGASLVYLPLIQAALLFDALLLRAS